MESFVFLFLFLGCMAALLAVAGFLGERKRVREFQELAHKYGLSFRAEKDYKIPLKFGFLNHLDLGMGQKQHAFNIIEGFWQGVPLLAFDYNRTIYSGMRKGDSESYDEHSSIFILFLRRQFPELLIYPENFVTRIGRFLGFQRIDFESIEFSRAFVVKSADKKFAYDVCHIRMMEYLLDHQDLSLEIENDCLSFAFAPRLSPEEVEKRLAQIVEIRKLLPDYLFRD